jgi:hypothetical protein
MEPTALANILNIKIRNTLINRMLRILSVPRTGLEPAQPHDH